MNELNIFNIGSASLVLNVLNRRPAFILLESTKSSMCSENKVALHVSTHRSFTVLFSSISLPDFVLYFPLSSFFAFPWLIRSNIYWGYIHFVDWSVIKLSEFYIWRTALWTLGSRVIYQERASQLTVTISQDPTWNIIVHMTKIYFYIRERDSISWGYIHFVIWSLI